MPVFSLASGNANSMRTGFLSCCFSVAVDEPNKSEEIHAAAASTHKVTEAPTPTDEDVSLALILPLLNGF